MALSRSESDNFISESGNNRLSQHKRINAIIASNQSCLICAPVHLELGNEKKTFHLVTPCAVTFLRKNDININKNVSLTYPHYYTTCKTKTNLNLKWPFSHCTQRIVSKCR